MLSFTFKNVLCRTMLPGLALCALLVLPGCENVRGHVSAAKDRVSNIQLAMPALPKVQPGQQAMQTDQKSDAPPFIPYDYGKHAQRAPEPDTRTPIQTVAAVTSTCPAIQIVEDLRYMHQFENSARPRPDAKISSIALAEAHSNCSHNDRNIALEMNLVFEGQLGPKARIRDTDRPSFSYPYFIAVTAPDGRILAKEVFAATLSYGQNQDNLVQSESMRQIIPLQGSQFDDQFNIVAGFQLSESELAYNRALILNQTMPAAAPSTIPVPDEQARSSVTAPKPAEKPAIVMAAHAEPEQNRSDNADQNPAAPAAEAAAKKRAEAKEKEPAIDVPFINADAHVPATESIDITAP